ncbi:MAG: DUF4349 domain-containing protein [Lachnospiraceae bacterium]|nr:DUF4349 domain-containing protein [Lachnospiraceae bacterium]
MKKAFLAAALLAFVLAGCGSSYDNKSGSYTNGGSGYYATQDASYSAGFDADYDFGYESSEAYENTSAESGSDVRAGRKLIRTVNLQVETMDFDSLLSYLENRTQELGGYVESLNSYNGSSYNSTSYSGSGYRNNRTASLTLRIPKNNLDSFLVQVAENSNITSRSEREVDVTLDYVDLDSHKAVLLAEQERLLSFLEQAETVEEMIMLESRLSEVRYQIESMERQLRTYDNQIEYSTVYLDITEVVELTPVPVKQPTTWERISNGFMDSLKNIGKGFREFFVWFIVTLPYLVLFAVIILVIVLFTVLGVKKGAAKRKKRAEAFMRQQQEYMKQMQQNRQLSGQNVQTGQNAQIGQAQAVQNGAQPSAPNAQTMQAAPQSTQSPAQGSQTGQGGSNE